MQVDTHVVVTGLTLLISLLVGVFSWLFRYTMAQREKESERRLGTLETAGRECNALNVVLAERLRLDEIKTVQLEGRATLIESNHNSALTSLREIRDQQVPRSEWEQHNKHVEGQLTTIIANQAAANQRHRTGDRE